MAEINEPAVYNFVDRRIRLRCELLEKLKLYIVSDSDEWTNVVQPILAGYASTDTISNRVSEGLPAITKSELTSVLGGLSDINDEIAVIDALIAILAVNAPRIN